MKNMFIAGLAVALTLSVSAAMAKSSDTFQTLGKTFINAFQFKKDITAYKPTTALNCPQLEAAKRYHVSVDLTKLMLDRHQQKEATKYFIQTMSTIQRYERSWNCIGRGGAPAGLLSAD